MIVFSLGYRAPVLKSQSNMNNFNCESIDEMREWETNASMEEIGRSGWRQASKRPMPQHILAI